MTLFYSFFVLTTEGRDETYPSLNYVLIDAYDIVLYIVFISDSNPFKMLHIMSVF